jgi:hypothetical protein
LHYNLPEPVDRAHQSTRRRQPARSISQR